MWEQAKLAAFSTGISKEFYGHLLFPSGIDISSLQKHMTAKLF
jgi:hypothetical protein